MRRRSYLGWVLRTKGLNLEFFRCSVNVATVEGVGEEERVTSGWSLVGLLLSDLFRAISVHLNGNERLRGDEYGGAGIVNQDGEVGVGGLLAVPFHNIDGLGNPPNIGTGGGDFQLSRSDTSEGGESSSDRKADHCC